MRLAGEHPPVAGRAQRAAADPRAWRRTPLPVLLGKAHVVVFDLEGSCETGAPDSGEPRACRLHPLSNPFVGGLALRLAARSRRPRAAGVWWRVRAGRAWSAGSILLVRGIAWVPSECWSERIACEAARRLYMRLCDSRSRASSPLPEFRFVNRWSLPGSGPNTEIARMRARAEEERLAERRLTRRGRRRFARFGRDPEVPLGRAGDMLAF